MYTVLYVSVIIITSTAAAPIGIGMDLTATYYKEAWWLYIALLGGYNVSDYTWWSH